MSDRVVIDGDMSLTSTIDGEGGAYIRLGQNPVIEALNVTENGTYEVPEGVDGFNPVTVDTGLVLLASINPQVGQKNCKIDLDNEWLSKYKHFIIVCDIRIAPSNGSEWVYYLCNTPGYTGGRYYSVASGSIKEGRIQGIVTANVGNNKILLPNISNVFAYNSYNILPSDNYLNVKLFTYDYDEGTIIKLYGIT